MSYCFLTGGMRDYFSIQIELLTKFAQKKYSSYEIYAMQNDKPINCLLTKQKLGDYDKFINICNYILNEISIDKYPFE
jgi:hypothetical protein